MAVSHCYTLIHALTMSEKRQFVAFSERHVVGEEKKYLALFHILESMPTYNEHQVQKAMREKGLNTKWFKGDQNYLYNQLLEHLAQFHNGKSGNLQVKAGLMHIEILFDKGLFRQCRKEIEKAMALARMLEFFELQIQILFWERKIALATSEKTSRTIAQILDDLEQATAMIAIGNQYLLLYEKAESLRQRVIKTRKPADLAAFRKLLKDPLLGMRSHHPTKQSQIRFHQIHAMWAYLHKAKDDELAHNYAIIKLFDRSPEYRNEYPLDYIAIYSRILSILKLDDAKVFHAQLTNFRAFEPDIHSIGYRNIRAQIFAQSYMIELSAYLTQGNFSDAMRTVRAIEASMPEHAPFISKGNSLSFQFMISYALFANGEYKSARSALNQLLNEYDDKVRPDLYNFARLLSLMTHLELGNYSNIRSQASSIAYYFRKHGKLYATENKILNYFNNPEHYKGRRQLHYLELIEAQLEKIRSASIEKYALGYIDFFTWIASRRERVPMSTIAGRRNKRG
ncbi:MAG TPA: hypothetical protein PKN15_14435 [Chitinophagales bacterium]|nr:hypothetical protein [Chitinophagales bacterium]